MGHEMVNYILAVFKSTQVKLAISFLIAVVLEIVGKNYLAYEVVFILIAIDTITGFMCGWKSKEISSRRFARIFNKLIVYFLLIISAHQMARYEEILRWIEEMIVSMILFNEFVSITENASRLGIPVPNYIKDKLHAYVAKKYD